MNRRRGAAAVEYALVLPVMLLVILGLVDWSVYMYTWLNVDVAASRGVRIAAGHPDDPEGAAYTDFCAALTRLDMDCSSAAITTSRTSDASGEVMVMSAVLPFTPPAGFVPTPSQMRITASTSWYGWLYADP